MLWDLGGYTLSSTAGYSAFYIFNIHHENLIIQNGVIDNWNYGVRLYSGSTLNTSQPLTVKNVTFTNNNYDIYAWTAASTDLLVENCEFRERLYFSLRIFESE
jgi:hypothetical protein